MKNRTRLPAAALAAVLALAPTSLLRAQTTTPANPNADRAGDGDVITLKEFSVTSTALSEYAAAESTTGTRVAAQIRDLPFNVQVAQFHGALIGPWRYWRARARVRRSASRG